MRESLRRDARGDWKLQPDTYVAGDTFVLPELTEPMSVDEIYEGILDAEGGSLLR